MPDTRRIKDTHEFNFMTSTIVEWLPVFESEEAKMIVIDSLKFCQENKGLEIAGWVLMIDHLHIIARSKEGYKLSSIMRDFKRHTATQLKNHFLIKDPEHSFLKTFLKAALSDRRNNLYHVWQRGLFAARLTSEKRFQQKLDYIHANPVKAGIVESPDKYRWSSAIDYFGGVGLLRVTPFDFCV